MTNILISGAAGFIGFALADALSKHAGNHVFVVDNFERGECDKAYEELCARSSVTKFTLDLTDMAAVRDLPSEVDAIFHMAALNGTQNFYERPYDVARCSTLPTFNLIDFYGPKGRIKRFFYAGSSEAYADTVSTFDWPVPTSEDVPLCISDPRNPRWSYGAAKLHGEVTVIAGCKQFAMNYTIGRYHNVYGPRMGDKHIVPDFLQRMKRGLYALYGFENTRSFIYINDAVKATQQLFESDGAENEIVNIGGENEIRILDLGSELMKLANLTDNIELHEAPEGSVMRRAPNTSKLRRITGFEEDWTLTDGLRETMKYYLG